MYFQGIFQQIYVAVQPALRLLFQQKFATRHRRTIAALGSVALHLLLIFALLPPAPQGFSARGHHGDFSGEGEGLSLDLLAASHADPTALQIRGQDAEALSELDALEKLDSLNDKIEIETFDDSLRTVFSQPEVLNQSALTAKRELASAAQQGGAGTSGASSGASDDLWNAIAPCWRRLAGADARPVNLTVTFGANGMLSDPPIIRRDDNEPLDPTALHSESLAITALAECGAYQMAAGRENVDIHFPTP